jgi:methylglutaconyl-CoA hydratase
MADPKVLLRIDGPVATVQLNNPERYNALSRQVVEELAAAAHTLAAARDVRAVILHGGDAKAFCSGADLKERAGLSEPQVIATVHLLRETVNLYARLPMPVIAAVHGIAFGGGCELALAADLRVISEEAQIGLTETSWAIIPAAGGCARLPQLVGPAVAKELIFTARKLMAHEALQIGLVNRVVARERLLPTAREIAEQIAANGPLAVRAAKRALSAGQSAVDVALVHEWQAYQAIIPTEDRLEGLRAFAEKRPPVYKGE